MTITVYDKFKDNYRWTRHNGRFGIEFETESLKPYDYPKMKYWNVVRDGSLRNYSAEYVLKVPMSMPEIKYAFEEFDNLNFDFIKDAHSTSSHIHINMLNEAPMTMANFIVLYTLYENVFISMSGEDRLSNLFCQPIKDSEGCLDNLGIILKALTKVKGSYFNLDASYAKYSALNAAPMGTLGSLELRMFKGITKSSEFLDFLRTVDEFVNNSSKFKDPSQIFQMQLKEPEKLFNIMFPNLDYKSNKHLVDKNIWYFTILSTGYDWKKVPSGEKGKIEPDYSPNNLNKTSNHVYGMNFDDLTENQKRAVIQRIHLGSGENPKEVNRLNRYAELVREASRPLTRETHHTLVMDEVGVIPDELLEIEPEEVDEDF